MLLGLASLLLAGGCASPPAPPGLQSDGRIVMGTILEASLVSPPLFSTQDLRETFEAVFAEASRLDALMSTFEPESDVSRLNSEAGRGPLRVDRSVAELLSQAVLYSRLTRGTFDVTVGPLVELWVEAARRDEVPTREALAAARDRVGFEFLAVHADGRAELLREGTSIDLGGIAKGYALDRIAPILRSRGVRDALLNFGQSSTWALGAPPGAPGWQLLVRGVGEGFLGVVTLHDQALSVSGSFGQSTRIGGTDYGHVLDPRSGIPLTRPRQAVVVAPNATLAEALSKALLVGGEIDGLAFVEAVENCEGMLAEEGGAIWVTSGWRDAVFFRPARGP